MLVVTGGPALIGPELDPIPSGSVLIEDGEILYAGPAQDLDQPPDAEIVDAAGGLICPGFIDAHVHIGFVDPAEVLAGGVTSARDLAWPPEKIFDLVARSKDAGFEGPELIAAGPMLTAPGGYPTRAAWAPEGTGREIEGEEQARTAVRELVTAGARVIKIALNPEVGPVLDLDTVSAIVDETSTHGLDVTGHVYGLDELEKALDAGVDELAHMLMSEEAIPDSLIDRMVEQGMGVVSTLSIRTGSDLEIAIDNTRRFVRAGGVLLYGTDLGNDGPRPGIDRLEVQALSAAGLSTREIVKAATAVPSYELGFDDRGALSMGKRADVVVLGENALDSPMALTDVLMVIKAGHPIS